MTKCGCINCECKECGNQTAPWEEPWFCDEECNCCDN
jgi:hypothetical protein